MIGHDLLVNSLKITGEIVTQSPIYIGSGQGGTRPAAIDMEFIKLTTAEKDIIPYIPGSTLKGVIRSSFEKILNTLKQSVEINVCDILNNPCVGSKPPSAKERKKEIEALLKTNKYDVLKKLLDEYLCEACRVFGNTVYGSHVMFMDAIGKSYEYGIRPGIAISRTDGSVISGGLFFIEFVAPGSVFEFMMHATNLEKYQIGLLATVFYEINMGRIKVGGLKSRGLGSIKLRFSNVSYVNQSGNEKYDLNIPEKKPNETYDQYTEKVLQYLRRFWSDHVKKLPKK